MPVTCLSPPWNKNTTQSKAEKSQAPPELFASCTYACKVLTIRALAPQDAVVAGEYKASIAKFNQTAKQWTQQYAMGENKEALKPLMDMGFSEEQARAALNEVGGDVQAAVEKLLSGA